MNTCKRKFLIHKSKRLFQKLEKAYQEGKITWVDHDDLTEELWVAVDEVNCALPKSSTKVLQADTNK